MVPLMAHHALPILTRLPYLCKGHRIMGLRSITPVLSRTAPALVWARDTAVLLGSAVGKAFTEAPLALSLL
ncbi:unnamed protein product [Phytomonas sp. Hart1]|nr:unnamed protein product [Phytomonas sp. Hart1]|eukprot:CCW69353.1 unnamed protein product [Phytomonas sp. isolate Hart1]